MSQPRRRHRLPDGPETRARKRSISFPGNLDRALVESARADGHNNVSRIVQAAVEAYLNRRFDRRAA